MISLLRKVATEETLSLDLLKPEAMIPRLEVSSEGTASRRLRRSTEEERILRTTAGVGLSMEGRVVLRLLSRREDSLVSSGSQFSLSRSLSIARLDRFERGRVELELSPSSERA